jgi:quinoprotein glucose dehydrogenase
VKRIVIGLFGTCALLPVALSIEARGQNQSDDGRVVFERLCTGCHSAELVTPLRMSEERWSAVVDDMIVRGASGSEREFEVVVKYLAANFGRSASQGGQARESSSTPPPTAAPGRPAAAPRPANARSLATGWPVHGHDPGGMRHSPLRELTPANVSQLRRVWTYRPSAVSSGDAPDRQNTPAAGGSGAARPRGLPSQVTPLVVGDVMYLTTPYGRAVALEAETGKELWNVAIGADGDRPAQRGLAYWGGDGDTPPALFFGTSAGKLVALNARDGRPSTTFGSGGAVDVRAGMLEGFGGRNYSITSPPVIYRNLVITGSRVSEQPELGPPGDVRAWDARTGKLVWRFRTIPQPGETGHDTWEGDSWKSRSGANVWGFMTVDAERGLVFLPLGSVTYDWYGGDRKGANLFGSSLVALDAATGSLKWHFQTTHHDVWDYDLAAPPTLFDIARGTQTIPAVGQMTKQGLLFILDRTTGKPVFGVEERPVPQDGFWPGEHQWPTQPFPVKPLPLARNSFKSGELATITPEHRSLCEELLKMGGGVRTGGPYLPHGERPGLIFPGTLGGNNWHGSSFNPELGYLFTNTMNLAEIFQIVASDPNQTAGGPRSQRTKFWDEDRLWPCQEPPWGELSAVNVATGDIVWRVPLGSFPELDAKGVTKTGTPNLGGSISTAGGLVFVGATVDGKFRAFDARTGQELWVTDLGGAAHSVPITYQGPNGKQYVAVMAGGGGMLRSPSIAATLNVYALP